MTWISLGWVALGVRVTEAQPLIWVFILFMNYNFIIYFKSRSRWQMTYSRYERDIQQITIVLLLLKNGKNCPMKKNGSVLPYTIFSLRHESNSNSILSKTLLNYSSISVTFQLSFFVTMTFLGAIPSRAIWWLFSIRIVLKYVYALHSTPINCWT